jgi:hypothetical protein
MSHGPIGARQAAEFLSNYDFGLGGLDDALSYADGEMLGSCCGYEGLGGFVGQPLTASALDDARRVVAAAAMPGTEVTKVVAGRLARKGLELGVLAHQRAQVAFKARKQRDVLAGKVAKLQPLVDRLAASPSLGERERGSVLKQDQYTAARAAVRLDKVNAVATGLAQNAAAQAVIAQQIAGAVIAGKPGLTATLSDMYNKLGQSSASMQKVREQQIVNSAEVLDQDKLRALLRVKRGLLQQKVDVEVLLSCSPRKAPELRKQQHSLFAQVYAVNSEIQKLCRAPRPHSLDGLEWPGFLDKAVKSVTHAVSSVVKSAVKVAKVIAKPLVSVAKTAVNVAILPITTSVKLVTQGPAAAIGNVTHTMVNSFNNVRKAAGEVFVGLPCKFASSTVGKTALQIGAAAAGTAVGGPAGTVAGAIAANRSADVLKSVCGGLDKIGLTSGNFRTSKLGAALRDTALGIGKGLIDPKKLLRDATSAGTSLVGGSLVPTDLLNKIGGNQLNKLGIDAISKHLSLPGGASSLLKAVGVPTDVVGVLKAAGLPADAQSVLRAVGVPSSVKDVLKRAGVPTDLPSMLKATQVLQRMKLPVTPDNLARAMNVKGIQIPGKPGQFQLPKALPPRLNVAQIKKEADRRIAVVRKVQLQQRAAKSRKHVQSLFAQATKQRPVISFGEGSPANVLMSYV